MDLFNLFADLQLSSILRYSKRQDGTRMFRVWCVVWNQAEASQKVKQRQKKAPADDDDDGERGRKVSEWDEEEWGGEEWECGGSREERGGGG